MIFLLIGAAIGVVLIALAVQKRSAAVRSISRGLLISYFTLGLIVVAGELYFRYAFAQSENVITWATSNWLARYWHTNSLGFRDREWSEVDLRDKTTVMITGDSFAAGWGIEHPEDRFGDVLASHLGDSYAVVNLGVYGTNTPEQLDLLRQYPLAQPDVVIMQYFLNDINYTMLSMGLLPTATPTPAWAMESALANFLYTRWIGRLVDPSYMRDWWEDNYAAYDNAVIWEAHRAEIEAYIDYVDSINARLVVVIFPNMLDPVRSIPYVDRVAAVFEEHGHTDILRLFDAAAAWAPQDRMVSARDTHPSAAFHHHVGDLLYERFFSS